ncbi:hypothetical protein KQI63_08285 [bacterium]|nr:hypothetical protein [bacterium]
MSKTGLFLLLTGVLLIGCEPQFEQTEYTPANFRYSITTRQMVGDTLWALSFRSQLVDGPIESWVDGHPLALFLADDRYYEADTLITPTSLLEYRYLWENGTLDASLELPEVPYPSNVRINDVPIEAGSPTLFNEADSYRVRWDFELPLYELDEEMDGRQRQRTLDLFWRATSDTASVRTADSSWLFHAGDGDTVRLSFYLFQFTRDLYSGRGNNHRDPTIYGWTFFEAWSDTFQFRIRPRPDSTSIR